MEGSIREGSVEEGIRDGSACEFCLSLPLS